MKVAAFVISLERATARRAQVERIVQMCPIPCEKVAAVDGSKLSPAELEAVYVPKLFRPHNPFPRSIGNIGCFLSHRRIWQRILDEGLSAALILEDDVEIESGFKGSLDFAMKVVQPGDYVQFQIRDIGKGHPCIASDSTHSLLSPIVAPRRTAAQLVTRDAAERLLKVSKQIDRPIDGFLQMKWVTKVPIRVVVPSGIRGVSAAVGGSAISSADFSLKGKRLPERLWREFIRASYRMQIAILSRRYFTSGELPERDHCSQTK